MGFFWSAVAIPYLWLCCEQLCLESGFDSRLVVINDYDVEAGGGQSFMHQISSQITLLGFLHISSKKNKNKKKRFIVSTHQFLISNPI